MQEEATKTSRSSSPRGPNSGRAELKGILLVAFAIAVMVVLMCASQEAFARGRGQAGAARALPARPAAADPQGQRGRGWAYRGQQPLRTERTLKAIEMLRLKRLTQELRLNDDQRRIVREAYEKEMERKRDLFRERAQTLERMRRLMLAPEPTDIRTTEAEMRDLVLKFRQLEREIARTEWATQDEILEHLAAPQRVRCILFNERFDRTLRVSLGAFWQRKLNAPAPPPPADVPE